MLDTVVRYIPLISYFAKAVFYLGFRISPSKSLTSKHTSLYPLSTRSRGSNFKYVFFLPLCVSLDKFQVQGTDTVNKIELFGTL